MHYYAYEFSHAVLSPLRVGVQGMRAGPGLAVQPAGA